MSTLGGQSDAWEREYRAKQMLSPSNVPQADVVRFSRWLKKEGKKAGAPRDFYGETVLDLGSGTGRNAFYFAQQGAKVTGYELSDTALAIARKYATHAELPISYEQRNIGVAYQMASDSVDLILDITSSNSLMDDARAIYLKETYRVLKPGGFMLVRALSLEGDAHAKVLVQKSPGADPDSYVHPDLHIVEKVFTRKSFEEAYAGFAIKHLERTEHYAMVAGRRYKRQYWIAYLQKPV